VIEEDFWHRSKPWAESGSPTPPPKRDPFAREAMCVQLSGTPVQVIGLVFPGVRTTLMNQENDERAMPLDELLDEAYA
jgi:hypothetical protein